MSQAPHQHDVHVKLKGFYSIHPWKCQHYKDYSEILAYVEASGQWEVLCVLHATSGATAEVMAMFICNLINDHQKNQSLLNAAMEALRLCLEEDSLTFASELAADHVLRRADKVLSPMMTKVEKKR